MIAVLSIDLGKRAAPALRSRAAALIKIRLDARARIAGTAGMAALFRGALQGAGNSVSVLAVSQ
jgi:hypothetical protein